MAVKIGLLFCGNNIHRLKVETVVVWIMTSCSPVGGSNVSEEHSAFSFAVGEDRCSTFLRKNGNHLPENRISILHVRENLK
jgi:hypothetical protein